MRNSGHKIVRLSVDAGFTCPNRDGSKGCGGCTFCANEAFSPAYVRRAGSISEQLEAGKVFHAGKYPNMEYHAYFQSYSNTYAPLDVLRAAYDEALSVDGVCGLVIGTRPDCLEDEVIDLLEEYSRRADLMVEVGVESFYDATLERINRCHDSSCAVGAVRALSARGIRVGVHLIFGLPSETDAMILDEADILSDLPVDSVKIHQLQIIRGTAMAREWEEHPERFAMKSAQEYAALVAAFIKRLRHGIHVERFAAQAPSEMVLAPGWGLKPQAVQKLVESML